MLACLKINRITIGQLARVTVIYKSGIHHVN